MVVLHILIPFLCLGIGYWVALSRPWDLNAWLILVLLSHPETFISVSTFNWLPGIWLVLRLAWHLITGIMAPVAILWLGLLFQQRSAIDRRFPWFKWLVLVVQLGALAVELVYDYAAWYNQPFLPSRGWAEATADAIVNGVTLLCVGLYWVAIVEKFRAASTPDVRRRMRVLLAGSTVGLASNLIIWGILPRFNIDPGGIQWLGYASGILLLAFPLSVAYLVIVQRALDIRILIRIGTRYALARTALLLVPIAVVALLIYEFVFPLLQRKNNQSLTVVLLLTFAALLFRLFAVQRGMISRIQGWLDRKFFREAYNSDLVLSDLADHARRITDPPALIETVSNRVSEVLHVPRLVVLLRDRECFRIGYGVGISTAEPIELGEASQPVQHLTRTIAPALLYREQPADWFSSASHEQNALNRMDTELLLPLAGRNKLMGIMALGPKQSEEPYSPSDLKLLASVGTQTGLSLEINYLAESLAAEAERHQRIQREVEIAHEVQERLFPQQFPQTRGTELAGHCRPALGIGGDYYDVFELDDGRLALAIGDVSGKGIPAALLMASLRASLRGVVDDHANDLGRLMAKLNRLVFDSSAVNWYATFFFAIYDADSSELRYVNAGHNPTLIVRGDSEVLRLEEGGPVVGLLRDAAYTECSAQLARGDVLVAYTDGISEAMTIEDEEWGDDRMLAAAQAVRYLPAERLVSGLFDAAERFTAGASQHDDMTLLVMKLT